MAARMTLLLLCMLPLAAVLVSAGGPPAGSVRIVGHSYLGNGCPDGTTEVVLSSDLQSLTAIFSEYVASTPGPLSERRKSCTLSVDIRYPSGFTFTLADVTYRGFAQLDKGVVGTLAASYYFSGVRGTVQTHRRLPANINDNFEYTDKFWTFVYTPCHLPPRNLNLKSEIRVRPSSSKKTLNGIISVDSKDLSLKQVFRLVWKKC